MTQNTPSLRSRIMSACRSSDTAPELAVRAYLHARGFRFVLGGRGLPGRPDIVLRRYKTVVFVHGCFWHGHVPCSHYLPPRANPGYWRPKIQANRRRDRRAARACAALGWKVLVVWECEAFDAVLLLDKLRPLLDASRIRGGEGTRGVFLTVASLIRFRLRSGAIQARRYGARALRATVLCLKTLRFLPPYTISRRPFQDRFIDPRSELRDDLDEARFLVRKGATPRRPVSRGAGTRPRS